ncbi:DNA polymerase [Edwardsiella phage vB_EpM_ZHS]|nr:DNA polymerase [Edwardsiella phage vB_EpM_ZHS]
MSFFYNETKTTKKPKAASGKKAAAVIPIASLQQLGCSVCQHNDNPDLKSPKMEPSGAKSPLIYLLGSAPSEEEDEDNNHWTDKAGDLIYSKFGKKIMRADVRSNFITQCRGEQTLKEIECCRPRIVADIEATKPVVIVTIGDAPFKWVTGSTSNAMPHRGSVFQVQVGKHVCYCVPILYPNFVFKKKQFGKSEYELAIEFDVAKALRLAEDVQQGERKPAKVYRAPYDGGIELITGNEQGDMGRLERALADLAGKRNSALDLETSGLRPFFVKKPLMYMAAVGTFDRTVAFAIDHPDGWGTDARRNKVRQLFGEYIMFSGRKAAHNLAMELEWLHFFYGPDVLWLTEWDDTMAMAHTLDERGGTKGLGVQTLMHFGFDVKKLSNIDVRRMLEYPIKQTLRYNGLDTKWTDKLREHLEPLVNAENRYEYDRKVRLAPALIATEAKGLPVDFKYAEAMADKLENDIDKIEAKLRRTPEIQRFMERKGTFQASNPDHVLYVMDKILGRPEVRVEERGREGYRMTTDEEALTKMPSSEVPSAGLILAHRSASKLKGTYIEPVLERRIVCPDGKIRSKYSSMVAETGRLASEDPNVQNFPKRKHKEVRGMIYAPDGHIMAALDYGQIEFRVVGMASEDPALVKACWTGYDVHKFWAQRMVDLYPEIKDYIVEAFEVDWDEKGLKTLRQEAKNGWVFPQLFGSSVRSCAEQLHLPEDIAEDLAAEFWDEFRVVKKWQERLMERYAKTLYVETLSGRKRRGPMTKNQIINHPIQGTAFDIVGEAMCVLSEQAVVEDDPYKQPELNVHDDLTFILPKADHLQRIDAIAKEMCKPRFDYINVPLLVEASTGPRWHELEEIKVYKSHELFNIPNPYEKELRRAAAR